MVSSVAPNTVIATSIGSSPNDAQIAHAIARNSSPSTRPAIVSVVSVAGTWPRNSRATQTQAGGALAP